MHLKYNVLRELGTKVSKNCNWKKIYEHKRAIINIEKFICSFHIRYITKIELRM